MDLLVMEAANLHQEQRRKEKKKKKEKEKRETKTRAFFSYMGKKSEEI